MWRLPRHKRFLYSPRVARTRYRLVLFSLTALRNSA